MNIDITIPELLALVLFIILAFLYRTSQKDDEKQDEDEYIYGAVAVFIVLVVVL